MAELQAVVTFLFFDILAQIKTALEAEFCRLSNYGSRFGSFGWCDGLICILQSRGGGDFTS